MLGFGGAPARSVHVKGCLCGTRRGVRQAHAVLQSADVLLEPFNGHAWVLNQFFLVELHGRKLLGRVSDVLLQDKQTLDKGLNDECVSGHVAGSPHKGCAAVILLVQLSGSGGGVSYKGTPHRDTPRM